MAAQSADSWHSQAVVVQEPSRQKHLLGSSLGRGVSFSFSFFLSFFFFFSFSCSFFFSSSLWPLPAGAVCVGVALVAPEERVPVDYAASEVAHTARIGDIAAERDEEG
jgi:hypothetical protein